MAIDVAPPPAPAASNEGRVSDPESRPAPRQPPRRAAHALPAAGLALLLLATWEAGVRALGVPTYLLPAPSAVGRALGELSGALAGHTLATMVTATTGLAVAAVAGVALAVAIRSLPLVRRVLYPLLVVSQTIPMVVLAPLLVAWFGFGIGPKIGVVALVSFFPVVVSTVDGLDGAEPELVDVVVSMGASRAALLRHVLLPAALPGFFAGLAIAATYAMVGAVIAEWMGASSGLGLLITRSAASFRVDRVFAGVAVVAAVSVALFAAVRLLARLAMPWTAARSEERR